MAYFDQNNNTEQYVPVFSNDSVPEDDEVPEDDDLMDFDLEDDPEEVRARRRDRFILFFGIGDFISVVVGTVVILLLAALLFSLIHWLSADLTQSFALWQTKL